MLSCRRLAFSFRLSPNATACSLVHRYSSSSASTDLLKVLQEQSVAFEKKPTSTIAFETFVQTPAEYVANALVHIHDSVALPWWATIALTTVVFRAAVGASITITQQRFIERLQKVRKSVVHELEPQLRTLNMQAMRGMTATVAEERKLLKREVNRFTKTRTRVCQHTSKYRPFN